MPGAQHPLGGFPHRPALRLRLAQPPQTLQRENEDAANPVGAENRVTGSDLRFVQGGPTAGVFAGLAADRVALAQGLG